MFSPPGISRLWRELMGDFINLVADGSLCCAHLWVAPVRAEPGHAVGLPGSRADLPSALKRQPNNSVLRLYGERRCGHKQIFGALRHYADLRIGCDTILPHHPLYRLSTSLVQSPVSRQDLRGIGAGNEADGQVSVVRQ